MISRWIDPLFVRTWREDEDLTIGGEHFGPVAADGRARTDLDQDSTDLDAEMNRSREGVRRSGRGAEGARPRRP